MVFSSNIFLFAFLPCVLLIHSFLPGRLRNIFLFIASLGFYTWGSGSVVFLLLLSIITNHTAARVIDRDRGAYGRLIFYGMIAFNLGLLFYFKYFNFFAAEFARLFALFNIELPAHEKIALPIGISFFTFQAISYLGEIFREKQKPAPSVVDYGMYIALFPHLIAGPIVRYSDISSEIRGRSVRVEIFFEGIWRFALGLGKKVIIANTTGAVADKIFALPAGELSTTLAWLGALCYTAQIYFDFSGYSDMAIGLARMLGFHFPENFNQPYRAQSITEFWRRWHMTLSRWFRDFVYIPLGGNQRGPLRTYFNLWTVFFLCGLWHGADWTFIAWGLYHGCLLVIERLLRNRWNIAPRGVLGNLFTMLLVIIGWVLFRAHSIESAWTFIKTMFGFGAVIEGFQYFPTAFYLEKNVVAALVLALLFAYLPIERFKRINFERTSWVLARSAASFALLIYAAAALSTAAFNPFIYFRF